MHVFLALETICQWLKCSTGRWNQWRLRRKRTAVVKSYIIREGKLKLWRTLDGKPCRHASRFALHQDIRRGHVWNGWGTLMQSRFVQSVHRFQQQSVLVWEEVCFNVHISLYVCPANMNGRVYRNEITMSNEGLFFVAIGYAFLYNNAPSHSSQNVLQEPGNHWIESLQSLLRSPNHILLGTFGTLYNDVWITTFHTPVHRETSVTFCMS